VPLHLGVSRADSSRRLGAASPSWEPPPTAPQPVARHRGGGSPAPFLPSPPRRWACGWSPERGARPLTPSDYSGCGGAIIAPRGLLRAGRWLAASTAVLGAIGGSANAARHWIAALLGACRPRPRPPHYSIHNGRATVACCEWHTGHDASNHPCLSRTCDDVGTAAAAPAAWLLEGCCCCCCCCTCRLLDDGPQPISSTIRIQPPVTAAAFAAQPLSRRVLRGLHSQSPGLWRMPRLHSVCRQARLTGRLLALR
jgi:hypothetical protein